MNSKPTKTPARVQGRNWDRFIRDQDTHSTTAEGRFAVGCDLAKAMFVGIIETARDINRAELQAKGQAVAAVVSLCKEALEDQRALRSRTATRQENEAQRQFDASENEAKRNHEITVLNLRFAHEQRMAEIEQKGNKTKSSD